MLKGANKILAAALLMALGACGPSKEEQEAKAMLQAAVESVELKHYDEALALLDTLQARYPGQTAVRREALALRPVAIELATEQELRQCDSLIAAATLAFDAAKEKMVFVSKPELVEGYWVAKSMAGRNIMEGTGLQARVDESGDFYLISEVNGAGNLHHSSITLSLPSGESASSGLVPYDGELNYRINGSETVTFSSTKSDEIGRFVAANPSAAMTLTFNGENGKSKKVNLAAKDVQAIADAFAMAQAQKEGKGLTANKALLEKKLQLARSQQQRLKGGAQ